MPFVKVNLTKRAVKYRFLAKNPVKSSELIQCKKGRFMKPGLF
ncbi:hypothetical protein CHCC14814_4018 [Bacillus paralicheniformis]|nr:hypothetical protein CHCC14814_4018 [Bacillus paralicheniformis]